MKYGVFFLLLSCHSLSAGLIYPLETGFSSQPIVKDNQLAEKIIDYSAWKWLYLTENPPVQTPADADAYYFKRFFIEPHFDIIEITFQAGIFTGALTKSALQKKADYLQWLAPSTDIINYWH